MEAQIKILKKYFHLIIFISITILSLMVYYWVTKTPEFVDFIKWSQGHFAIYFITLVIIKIIAIVWPPIPGGLFTLGSIPIIGWQYAWIADLTGNMIGSSIAYYIGKKYGVKFLRKMFDEKTLEKVLKIKIKDDKELEAVVVLKLFYGSVSEVISYGSGLIGIKYRDFLIGTAASSILGLVIFYFANNIFSGTNTIISIILGALSVIFFFKLKNRYFVLRDEVIKDISD